MVPSQTYSTERTAIESTKPLVEYGIKIVDIMGRASQFKQENADEVSLLPDISGLTNVLSGDAGKSIGVARKKCFLNDSIGSH